MEIDSIDEAKELHEKCSVLIDKVQTNQVLTKMDRDDLVLILSKACFEFYECSQE